MCVKIVHVCKAGALSVHVLVLSLRQPLRFNVSHLPRGSHQIGKQTEFCTTEDKKTHCKQKPCPFQPLYIQLPNVVLHSLRHMSE